ncbi:AAA family ATPase [Coleofasciculus sp. C1-SOL-03]|uniref:AAA family ATPase n=1 Tax=Coleofasciculus sp. C1-SOL-03 TaxID=3069522 RepID=UPI0040632FF4
MASVCHCPTHIFKLGHIKTLYFQRQIERGFLLVDEPENSLYPDLLYDLIEQYLSIIQNTQFFVATHNPIIAAQKPLFCPWRLEVAATQTKSACAD